MNKRFQNMIYWLSNAGSLSSDTEEQRRRKAVLMFLSTSYCIIGTFWGIAYLALGLLFSASIPLGYAVVSGASLYYFLRTKRYEFFCFSQLALILVLPFLLQWSLGGFASSGAVMIWSILSPVGALMFVGTTRALPWFLAYLLIMALSIILNGKFLPHTTLPSLIVVISFVMNIGGVSVIVFFLLKYFVNAEKVAMAELDKEHRQVRHSLSLAMEVQQRLLPQADPKVKGLDIAGKSIYCDETGGDYYDFLEGGKPWDGKIGVVVGDVSGHGIPSALLMATVQALIRQCCSVYGKIDRVVSDVNRQLALDVKDSGRFMTLFYAEIDRHRKSICWLNAGHEPAIVFNPTDGTFDELSNKGSVPLGVFEDTEYRESQQPIAPGQIIVLATDGIIEAHNINGEMFGKNRLHDLIRRNATADAKEILNTVIAAVARFQKDIEPDDDMTLVVIKIKKGFIKPGGITFLKMDFYQKMLQKLEGIKNVLDIGCGNGTLDVFLAKKNGIRIVGLDISPAGFMHAQKKALANGVEDLVTCVKGSVYDMAFAEESEFDAVTLVYSLHHVEDPVSALMEARRVIKPGGKVLIVECIADDEDNIVCCIFNKPGLIATLNRAGFLNTKIEMLGTEDGHEFLLFEAVK